MNRGERIEKGVGNCEERRVVGRRNRTERRETRGRRRRGEEREGECVREEGSVCGREESVLKG